MVEDGYVKAYRKMMNWRWWSNSDTVKVFMYILFRANLKESYFDGKVIPRGSFVTSRKTIAHDCYISEQTTRTILNRLKSTNEITMSTTSKYTVISVVNYEEYQGTNQVSNQQLTNNQPTTNQQLTTEEEYKRMEEWKNKDTEEPSAPAPTKGKKKSSTLSYEEIDTILTERNLAEGVKKMIHDWCEYKREKRQAYKLMGLNSTIETMVELAGKYGEDEVNGAMRQCMSSNYDGLILEKFINQKGVNSNGSSKRENTGAGDGGNRAEPIYGSYEWYRSVGYKED